MEKHKGKVAVLVDEVSMLGVEGFNDIDESCRKLTGHSKERFGGMCVILVGDFYQLPAVLQHVLYRDPQALNDFDLLALNSLIRSDGDAIQQRVINGMRKVETCREALELFLKTVKHLSPTDTEFVNAPILVATNIERCVMNGTCASAFSRRTGQPVLRFQLPENPLFAPVSGSVKRPQNTKEKNPKVRNPLEGYFYFVLHAQAFVIENDPASGLCNGMQCVMHSISYNHSHDRQIAEAAMKNWVPGVPVNVPMPDTVNVTYGGKEQSLIDDLVTKYGPEPAGTPLNQASSPRGKDFRSRVEAMYQQYAPEKLATLDTVMAKYLGQTFPMRLCARPAKRDPYIEFMVAPGFSCTLHKAQGFTLPFAILQINKRPQGCGLGRLTFSSLYVGISRTRSTDHMRVFPPLGTGFQHVLDLRPDQSLLDWLSFKRGEVVAPKKRNRAPTAGRSANSKPKPPARMEFMGSALPQRATTTATTNTGPVSNGKRGRENETPVECDSSLIIHHSGIHRNGIRNLGNTCYMNSIFQSLCRLPVMMRKIAGVDHIQPEAHAHLYRFLVALISFNASEMRPELLRRHLPQPYDTSGEQQDVSEFFAALIIRFPLVAKAFMFTLQLKVSCNVCNAPSRLLEDKASLMILPFSGPGEHNMQEMVYRYFHPEIMEDENKVNCDVCGVQQDSVRSTTVVSFSDTMVVLVHRFEIVYVAGQAVFLPKKMQKVTNFCTVVIDEQVYSLKTLVSHEGVSTLNGHYVCLERVGDDFITYDDGEEPKIREQQPESTPYMFFYERVLSPENSPHASMSPPQQSMSPPPQQAPRPPPPPPPRSSSPPSPSAATGPPPGLTTLTPRPAPPPPRGPTQPPSLVRPRKSVMDFFKKK